MAEIELDEVIADAVGHNVAAGVDVATIPVSIVFKRDGAGDVVELDRLQSLVQVRAANVDGRLLVAAFEQAW